jgi:hypothetical protein
MKSASPRPLGFSVVLATALAIGVSVLWLFAFGWVMAIVQQFFGARSLSEQLYFTAEGKPLIQSSDYTSNTTVLRTLEGQTVDDVSKLELQSASGWLPTPDCPYLSQRQLRESSWSERVTGFLEMSSAQIFWYLMCDDDGTHAYFEGFDSKTRTRIGYLGKQGFRLEKPPRHELLEIDPRSLSLWLGRFAGQYGNQGREPYGFGMVSNQPAMVFVLSSNKLYRVDFRRRAIEPVATDEPVLALGNVSQPVRVPDQSEPISKRRIVLRMANQLQLMDEDGVVLRTIPLPNELRDRLVSTALTLSEEAVVVGFADPGHELTDIYWIDTSGKVARHQSARIAERLFSDHEQPMWQVALALPAPLAVSFATLVGPLEGVVSRRFDSYSDSLAHLLHNGWPWIAGVFVLAAVLAAATYRRQRRLSQPAVGLWTLLVFVLGPAGWIGYLVHRNWPATARCAQCGAVVPQDRLECAGCAAEFAPPARRGVEIFA